MPYNRPSLLTIIGRVLQDIAGRLIGAQPQLTNVVSQKTGQKRRSLLNIMGMVWSGVANAFYGRLQNLYNQILPDTQSSDMLSRTASLWLPGGRKQAISAVGNLDITGANGIDVPQGTQVSRADGVIFSTTADVVIAGGVGVLPLQAVVPGAAGNTAAATVLTFVAPIAGVTNTGAVDANGLGGGADQETDSALLARIQFRMQYPPRGGAPTDYMFWASNVPGVTRVWVTPLALGPNSVTVRIVNDNLVPITPPGALLTAVAAAIAAVAPLTSQVTVLGPTLDATTYSMHLVPNNANTQAAATASIAAMHLRLASVGGCELPNGNTGGTLDLSDIEQAVKTADGVTDCTITLINGAAPANIVSAAGHLAVPGVITFV